MRGTLDWCALDWDTSGPDALDWIVLDWDLLD